MSNPQRPYPLAVEFKNITKRYALVTANHEISFKVERGSLHGIIGENGAGKSTAMKLLYGLESPTHGEIFVNGTLASWKSPSDAIQSGVGMVHQHFMLAEPMTVLDHFLLGDSRTQNAFSWTARRKARIRVANLAEQYGLQVPLDAPIETLPVGIQQRVELLKLLDSRAEILILDEPTAVLTPQEVDTLFTQLRELKKQGKTILIITHKLREVMTLTDRVTVFRAGKVVHETETAQTSAQALADAMVGRRVELQAKYSAAKPQAGAKPVLKTSKIQVNPGEIVGIAGVEGNGQSELIREIVRLKQDFVGIIPEDRHHQGLILDADLSENFLLGLEDRPEFQRAGFLKWRGIHTTTELALEKYDVRPRNRRLSVGSLSGGNQQKLIVARALYTKPRLIIAAQPTRGVDVGAIESIHDLLVQARDEGAGVLLISSELDEVLKLSDRILVMYAKQIVAEFTRENASEQAIGLAMGGGHA